MIALRRAQGPSLLKALSAKNRASLSRPEGNRGFFPALRTAGFCFRPHWGSVGAASAAFRAFGFAAFAAFWLVFKSFVGEKHLFAGGKNELRITIGTLQYPVVVFHEPLSPGPLRCREAGSLDSRTVPLKMEKLTAGNAGCFPQGPTSSSKTITCDSLTYGA
jgi:hypothetical protein